MFAAHPNFSKLYTLLVDSGGKNKTLKAFYLKTYLNNLKINYSIFKQTPITVIAILENVWSMKMRTVS